MSSQQSSDAHETLCVSPQPPFASSYPDLDGESVHGESGLVDVGEFGDAVPGALGRQSSRFAGAHGRYSESGLQKRLGRGQSTGGERKPTGHPDRPRSAEVKRSLRQGSAQSHVDATDDASDARCLQNEPCQRCERVFSQRLPGTQYE